METGLQLKLHAITHDIEFARGDTNQDLVNDLYEGTPIGKKQKKLKIV
jgi:hypothetical protein